MGKKVKKNKDQTYQFIMSGKKKTYYSKCVIIHFDPKKVSNKDDQAECQMKNISIIPTFNSDLKSFTPSFVLPSSKKDDQEYLDKHRKKRQQHTQIDESQIMVPKPRNKYYCHSCEETFEDYLEHSESKTHIEQIQTNRYQRRICKMALKFRKKYQKQEAKQSSQEVSDSLAAVISADQSIKLQNDVVS